MVPDMTVDDQSVETTDDNVLQPFQIESVSLRGRSVRLGEVVETILTQHDYPEPVAVLLGEALALTTLLASALKYDGVFTLQTKGDGPVGLVVADLTTDGAVRGYAQYNAERLAKLACGGAREPVPRLLGAGHLAFTVDQGVETERYQGIVELRGATLAECAHLYFRQSEQLDAAVKLACGRVSNASGRTGWRAGGLMVQRLPGETAGKGHEDEFIKEEEEDGWRRALVLMGSGTTAELLDPGLHPHRLLYRLFHEDGVRVFRQVGLRAECRCARARVVNMLRALPRPSIEDLKEEGLIVVTCEFCNGSYRFDDAELESVYAD